MSNKNTGIKDILKAVESVSGFAKALAAIFETSDEKHLRKNFRLIYKHYRKKRRELKKGGLTAAEKVQLKEINEMVKAALNKILGI